MTKLTLSVDERVLREAKRLAKRRGTSVSAMFSHFVRAAADQGQNRRRLGPLTRKASGMARLPKGKTYRRVLEDALLGKHELDS